MASQVAIWYAEHPRAYVAMIRRSRATVFAVLARRSRSLEEEGRRRALPREGERRSLVQQRRQRRRVRPCQRELVEASSITDVDGRPASDGVVEEVHELIT
jgi:hypothetical protein